MEYRVVYFTELQDHNKEHEINRAMAGEHFCDGFIRDFAEDKAKAIIDGLLARMNGGERLTPGGHHAGAGRARGLVESRTTEPAAKGAASALCAPDRSPGMLWRVGDFLWCRLTKLGRQKSDLAADELRSVTKRFVRVDRR